MAADSIRTCAGCGAKAHPDELERFVLVPDMGLLHDVRGKAPGRGAHVHADIACLRTAAKHGFRRAFKTDIPDLDGETFLAEVRDAIANRLVEHARVAVRCGDARVGQNAVSEAMRIDEVTLVFIANDAGDSAIKKYSSNAERKEIPTVTSFGGAELGGWIGKEFVAVLSVTGASAARLSRDVKDLERLGFFEG